MRKTTRDEVRQLLGALEKQATGAFRLVEAARKAGDGSQFSVYLSIRKQFEEMQSLLDLAEGRVELLDDPRKDALRREFEQLYFVGVSLQVKAAHAFFTALPEKPALPMGAADMFRPELRALRDAREKMTREKIEGEAGGQDESGGLTSQIDEVVKMIGKVTGRGPRLTDFGAEEAEDGGAPGASPFRR